MPVLPRLAVRGFRPVSACHDSTSPRTPPPMTAEISGRAWAGDAGRGDTIALLSPSMDTLQIASTDSAGGYGTTLTLLIPALSGPGTCALGGPSAPATGT